MIADLLENFPRLKPDNVDHCPVSMREIQEYLKLEDGDGSEDDRELIFLRTARAFNADYWVWEYHLEDGAHCYVTVEKSGREVFTGMDWDTGDLNPEEYIIDQRRRSGRI